ncbi:hypothetical protein M5001_11160, partial [Neisseria meningitidis]|nr:hypothetical protein [Neisseria meningitidis]
FDDAAISNPDFAKYINAGNNLVQSMSVFGSNTRRYWCRHLHKVPIHVNSFSRTTDIKFILIAVFFNIGISNQVYFDCCFS